MDSRSNMEGGEDPKRRLPEPAGEGYSAMSDEAIEQARARITANDKNELPDIPPYDPAGGVEDRGGSGEAEGVFRERLQQAEGLTDEGERVNYWNRFAGEEELSALEEAAKTLKAQGASRVGCLALTRALLH